MVRDQLSWSHKTWVHIEVVGLVTQLVRSCFDHIINVWSTGLFLGWAQLALHCKSPVAYTYGRQVMHLEWWRCQTDLSQLQTVDVTAAVQTKPELRQPPISGGINFFLLYCTVLASSHPTTKLIGLRTCTSGRVCSSVGRWRFPMWETPQPRSWLPPVRPSPSPQLWHDSAATGSMLHNVSPRVSHIFQVWRVRLCVKGHSASSKAHNHYWPYRTFTDLHTHTHRKQNSVTDLYCNALLLVSFI